MSCGGYRLLARLAVHPKALLHLLRRSARTHIRLRAPVFKFRYAHEISGTQRGFSDQKHREHWTLRGWVA